MYNSIDELLSKTTSYLSKNELSEEAINQYLDIEINDYIIHSFDGNIQRLDDLHNHIKDTIKKSKFVEYAKKRLKRKDIFKP